MCAGEFFIWIGKCTKAHQAMATNSVLRCVNSKLVHQTHPDATMLQEGPVEQGGCPQQLLLVWEQMGKRPQS